MKPELFPSEEIEKLYHDLENEGYSTQNRYAKLKTFGLVAIFKHENTIYYIHPNHQWGTYMFRIPMFTISGNQEKTNRSKIQAFKNLIAKWVFHYPTMNIIDDKLIIKLRKYFQIHMLGYATISIPGFLSNKFENEFKLTQSELVCITPNLERISCPECNHLFLINKEAHMIECPNCGFTFIK
jgi:DNA-directed RNA polymerase subunit RPC12/RpoP